MRTLSTALVLVLFAPSLAADEATPCATPGAVVSTPMNSVFSGEASATLSWDAASGASFYDVYLGPSDPPNLYAEGITGTSLNVDGLADGTTYFWYVVAHADCDETLTTRTSTKQLTTSGSCQAVGGFSQTAPSSGATGVSTLVDFQWTAAGGAASYDLYLGRTENPALVLSGITGTSIEIPRLLPSTTYYWKVVARSGCNSSSSSSSPIIPFQVTNACPAPETTSISFVPESSVSVGQTYAIAWSPAAGIDAGGSYIIERSTSSAFNSNIVRQQTTSNSASFITDSTGTYHHRVKAVAGCSSSSTSGWSSAGTVNVTSGRAMVVITRPPDPVITELGELLEDQRSSFVMENLGTETVQVRVSRQELASVPFFQIIDPFGGSSSRVNLEPRTPKTMDLRFSGPPNDVAGTFQGVITVAPRVSSPIVSYTWINLKIGDVETATAPKFLVNGLESEYAFFAPRKGDDSDREALTVDVLNKGNTPMDLTSEVGPEIWLQPESGWNKSPIAPNDFRPVRLTTLRFLAPNNSALPRYTYFTVRNRSGESARLLVQDNTEFAVGEGRASLSSVSDRSFVVPTVTSEKLGNGGQRFTRLRMTNVGGAAVQTDLYYVPTGQDGYDGDVLRATVVLPPNDVVNITDPLGQLFNLPQPANGQLEIRASPEKIGLVSVSATTETRIVGGGVFLRNEPTLLRGEGAIVGSSHVVAGIVRDGNVVPDLVLVETTGRDSASVRATLRDSSGSVKGDRVVEVPRYGRVVVADVVQALGGGSSGSGFRVDVVVESGGGAVVANASSSITGDRGGMIMVSVPVTNTPAVSSLGRGEAAQLSRYVVPGVVSGIEALPGAGAMRTELTLLNTGTEAIDFTVTFNDESSGQANAKTVSVSGGGSITYADVLANLWGASPARGSLTVESDPSGKTFASLRGDLNSGVVGDRTPVVSTLSESLTGSGSLKPLYADGVEQSTEDTRGSRSALILAETSGRSASVVVRLYEAGNRSFPLVEKQVSVPAGSQITLDGLFDALEMSGDSRNKDRTNMQCVVVPDSATGLIAAMLRTTDNVTGEIALQLLQPVGGVPATGIQKATVEEPVGGRRRPIRR